MSYQDYSKEDLNRIKEMFNFLDKNKEGIISVEDLNLGIIGLGGELSGKEISELINMKDQYDLEDFISICQKKRININEIENKLLLAFSLLETDKKGYIPSSSLITLLKNDKIPDKEIQQLINEAKPDSDNNIEYKNFVKEMLDANLGDETNSPDDNNKYNNSDNDENYNSNNNDNYNDKEDDNSNY